MGTVMSELNKKSNSLIQSSDDTLMQMESSDEEFHFGDNLDFVFPDSDSDNGLCFNQIYLPEEIVISILSYVPCNEILKLGLVCKRWYNVIRLNSLWVLIYRRKYNQIPKSLPWYAFYALFTSECFDNMLKNCYGEDKFNNWTILANGGNKFAVEKSPLGSDPFPSELQKATGCFVTSFGLCCKTQKKLLSKLIRHIVQKFKPHIYACEWVAGRFDCGGKYALEISVFNSCPNDDEPIDDSDNSMNDGDEYDFEVDYDVESQNAMDNGTKDENISKRKETFKYQANEATQWKKIEVQLENYPDGVEGIIFKHSGIDNQFWRGHYGPKMTGGQLKLLFDSMEPFPAETSHINIDDDLE